MVKQQCRALNAVAKQRIAIYFNLKPVLVKVILINVLVLLAFYNRARSINITSIKIIKI